MARLSNRYANALLELSEEKDSLEKDLGEASLVCDSLNNEQSKAFLVHPHIPNSAKHQLFQKAFSDRISKHLMGFLYLMVQKNREALIVPALTEYIKVANRRLGKTEARVVSANTLTEEQIKSIQGILSRKLNAEVEIKTAVDPDVIGGFYILVDGHVFDGTVRSRLNTMKERLKRGGCEC